MELRKSRNYPDATHGEIIEDLIRIHEGALESASTAKFDNGYYENLFINQAIRKCHEVLGASGNNKNGCLYRESGTPERWKKGCIPVTVDHAVPVTQLVQDYFSGVPLKVLAFSPVARISKASDQVMTKAGLSKSGHKKGFPLYRYALAGIKIETHEGRTVDPATWTDEDHWNLVRNTRELQPVLEYLGV